MKTRACDFDRICVDSYGCVGITGDGDAPSVVRLDGRFHPVGTPIKLRDGTHVLGMARGVLWYADDGQSRAGTDIWSLDLRTGRERRQAACPEGVVPCGLVELRSQEACILGLHDDAVVRLVGHAYEPFWSATAAICPVGLPTVWGQGWSCLCEDNAGKRMLLVGNGTVVTSRVTMPPRTHLAASCGDDRVVCVECTDGGHIARILLVHGARPKPLELPRGPLWPVAMERVCDAVVLHYSSLGKRRAVAFDAAGRMTPFAPWCRPVMKHKAAWWIRRSSPITRVVHSSDSPSLRQVRWTGHRGVAMRGWLWTPQRSSRGAVMRLHGGPGVACDQPRDRWTESLLDAGYQVFQPDLPGSGGYGDTLIHSLRGEALVRSVHEDVATAAQICAKECSTTAGEISLLGESLGGYLALFAGMKTCGWRPRCVIAVNGFGDLLFDYERSTDAMRGVMAELLGTPAQDSLRYTLASASTWAHDDVPPLLLISSAKDKNVRSCNSTRMRSLLRRAKQPVELLRLARSAHDVFAPEDRAVALDAVKGFLGRRQRRREPPLLLDVFRVMRPVLESPLLFDPSPNASDTLATRCVKSLAHTNNALWCLEDEARAPGKSLADLGAVKKRIDACNQRRNDLIADLDAVFAQCRCAATAGDESPRTESPASALDRLTILALRRKALRSSQGGASAYRQRAAKDVDQAWEMLLSSIAQLFEDLQTGRCSFQNTRPWKLYNDPMLSVHGNNLATP